jgi:hypothetical protein
VVIAYGPEPVAAGPEGLRVRGAGQAAGAGFRRTAGTAAGSAADDEQQTALRVRGGADRGRCPRG